MDNSAIYEYLCLKIPKTQVYTNKTVLISAPYMMYNIQAFTQYLTECGLTVIVADVQERLEETELLEYKGQYDVALIGDDRYSAKVLDQTTNKEGDRRLLGLCKWGTGIDSIDLEVANLAGIKVLNTPDAFSEPVAESILGAILAFNRTLLASSHMLHTDKTSWVKIPGKTLFETRIGIIGFGNVGRALSRKLLLLGIGSIMVYDIIPGLVAQYRDIDGLFLGRIVQVTNLVDLLGSKLDFLVIACCQTKDNIGMIGEAELQLLDANCVLINMARGRLVDETALVKSLTENRIKGVALDVFWDEPLGSESALRDCPNAILTSHNANTSPHYWLKVHENTIRNMFKILADC